MLYPTILQTSFHLRFLIKSEYQEGCMLQERRISEERREDQQDPADPEATSQDL